MECSKKLGSPLCEQSRRARRAFFHTRLYRAVQGCSLPRYLSERVVDYKRCADLFNRACTFVTPALNSVAVLNSQGKMRAFYLATIAMVTILCSVRPVLGQCTDFNEFTVMTAPLNEACCEGAGTDCSMGIPSTCPGDCATVLLPMRTACGDFLKDDGAMFKDLIDKAVAQCAATPSTGTCPCLNGK